MKSEDMFYLCIQLAIEYERYIDHNEIGFNNYIN